MDRINRQEDHSQDVEQKTNGLDPILRIDEVMRTTGLGRSTIYRGMNEGSFPVSLELGERARGWRQSDIERWLSERPTTRLAG